MVREGKVVMGQSGSPIDNYASRAEYVGWNPLGINPLGISSTTPRDQPNLTPPGRHLAPHAATLRLPPPPD